MNKVKECYNLKCPAYRPCGCFQNLSEICKKNKLREIKIKEDLPSSTNLNYIKKIEKKLLDFSKEIKEEAVIAVLCSPVSCNGFLLMSKSEYRKIIKKSTKGYPMINKDVYYDKKWFEWKKGGIK